MANYTVINVKEFWKNKDFQIFHLFKKIYKSLPFTLGQCERMKL